MILLEMEMIIGSLNYMNKTEILSMLKPVWQYKDRNSDKSPAFPFMFG